jgi:hypothetical protein
MVLAKHLISMAHNSVNVWEVDQMNNPASKGYVLG